MWRSLKPVLLLFACLAISPGLAAQSPALVVNGVDDPAKENILNTINLSQYQCTTRDWQLGRLEQNIQKEANLALQAVGYYHAEISSEIVRSNQCWSISLNIVAGPRTTVAEVSVSIDGDLNNQPEMQKLLKALPVKPDQPLNHGNYSATKTEIGLLATRYGYFSGEFTENSLTVDPMTNTAQVKINYDSGPAITFGAININQTYLNDDIFNDYLVIKSGDKYDSRKLIRQQQLLQSSGFFSRVSVTGDQNSIENNEIPININASKGTRFSYKAGVGASTDIGPRLSLDYTDRRVNKRGHNFKSSNTFSARLSEITGNYSIPRGKAGIDRIDLQLGYQYEDTDTFRESSYKFAAQNLRQLSSGWLTTTFIEYLYADYTTFAENDSDRNSRFTMPGVSMRRSRSDNPVFPRDGYRINATLRVASDAILSSSNLVQGSISGKFIQPLGNARVLARFDAATTEVGDFEKLPASLRYYAGGDGSVRGFDYKTLGPTNTTDEVVGGRNLLTASIEYEYPIRKTWGLALFIDTGNAFNSFSNYELSTGAGLGIRWHSPIGPIRLDLAQDVEGNQSPRLHLSMGLDL